MGAHGEFTEEGKEGGGGGEEGQGAQLGGSWGALQGGLSLGWGCLVPAVARGVMLLVHA
jgi:hypothetical protein